MPKWLLKQKSSSSDSFNAISGLYRTAEPQEALWHYPMVALLSDSSYLVSLFDNYFIIHCF